MSTRRRTTRRSGFYAARLPRADVRDLEAAGISGLAQEIALLRVALRRYLELTIAAEDPHAASENMRSVCLALTTLNRLIKTQAGLAAREISETEAAIRAALAEVAAELVSGEEPPGDAG